eukprot:365534-Chlamydomonas_euryale.AAC.9
MQRRDEGTMHRPTPQASCTPERGCSARAHLQLLHRRHVHPPRHEPRVVQLLRTAGSAGCLAA